MSDDEYTCPNGCDLHGAAIPQSSQELYGGATHFSRMVGIDGGYTGIYDGVIAWYCPDCGVMWPRTRFADDPHVRQYVDNANGLSKESK